jgi:hypothetical protein
VAAQMAVRRLRDQMVARQAEGMEGKAREEPVRERAELMKPMAVRRQREQVAEAEALVHILSGATEP